MLNEMNFTNFADFIDQLNEVSDVTEWVRTNLDNRPKLLETRQYDNPFLKCCWLFYMMPQRKRRY